MLPSSKAHPLVFLGFLCEPSQCTWARGRIGEEGLGGVAPKWSNHESILLQAILGDLLWIRHWSRSCKTWPRHSLQVACNPTGKGGGHGSSSLSCTHSSFYWQKRPDFALGMPLDAVLKRLSVKIKHPPNTSGWTHDPRIWLRRRSFPRIEFWVVWRWLGHWVFSFPQPGPVGYTRPYKLIFSLNESQSH